MAYSETLLPDGTGVYDQGGKFGAATNWECMVDDNGDTSYVYMGGGTYYSLCTLTAPTPALSVLETVEGFAKTRYAAGVSGSSRGMLCIPVSPNQYSFGAYLTNSGSHQLTPANTDRPGGGTWDVSDLATLQAGVEMEGDEVRCTYTYVVASGQSGGDDWVDFLFSLFPWISAAGLGLDGVLRRHVSAGLARRRVSASGRDLDQICRSILGYRWPRSVWLHQPLVTQ